MSFPDPKWLEILKAGDWQTTAGAAAFGLFLLGPGWGLVPQLEPWMLQLAFFGLLLCAFLALASMLSALSRLLAPDAWVRHWITVWRDQRRIADDIEHMNEDERRIIAYLLAHDQKMFTAAQDGGRAVTLISKKFIVRTLQPGQFFDLDDMPFSIPGHIWRVLKKRRAEFPYKPPPSGRTAPHPWRVSWMAR